MLFFSVNRFFVISFPLKARYFKIIRFPKLTVLALFAVVFSFHIYMPFKYQVTQARTGGYRLGYTDWFRASRKEFDAVSIVGKFLFSYIPLFTGLALSVALMVALRKHAKATANLQEAKDDSKARQARQAERQLAMTIWVRCVSSRPNNYCDHHPDMFLCKARTSSIEIDHLGTSSNRLNNYGDYHQDMFLCI